MQRSTLYFVIILVAFGLGVAGAYVYWKMSDSSLQGYYSVSDTFTDSTGTVQVSVSFIQVTQYDSVKALRVAELLTRQAIEGGVINNKKEREFLYHFFVPGDTAVLTREGVEELAYTHPSITNPTEKLISVPGGWVVRATFASSMIQPKQVEAKRSAFYMPRKGIRAKDLR